MSSSPHPYRQELMFRWSAFLGGRADRASTVEYIEKCIADYGPEELVHDGVQLLNDDLLTSRGGEPTSRARFDSWQRELAKFDEDPAQWDRDWAMRYAERVLPPLRPASRAQFVEAMGDKLTDADVEELSRRFEIP